jgi:hypothetical protein
MSVACGGSDIQEFFGAFGGFAQMLAQTAFAATAAILTQCARCL